MSVWLIAIALPTTFSERTTQEVVQNIKNDLNIRINEINTLDEQAFTTESWSNLQTAIYQGQHTISELTRWFDDLIADQLVIESLDEEADVTEFGFDPQPTAEIITYIHNSFETILTELETVARNIEEAYRNLVPVETEQEQEEPTQPAAPDEDLPGEDDQTTGTPEIDGEDELADDGDVDEETFYPETELLTLTRSEFQDMTRAELEHYGVGLIPNVAAFNSLGTSNACPNLIEGGAAFATNVIVDGVVCVGNPEGFTPHASEEVSANAAFTSAWNNNAAVTEIILMGHLSFTGSPGGARTASIRLTGNGGHRLNVVSAGTTHPALTLGAVPAAMQRARLDLRDISFGRIFSSGTNANQTTGENIASIISTAANSSGWNIFIHDDVGTAVPPAFGGTGNNTINRARLIDAPDAYLYITGRRNIFEVFPRNNSEVAAVINVRGISLGVSEEGLPQVDGVAGASPAGMTLRIGGLGAPGITTQNNTTTNYNGYIYVQANAYFSITQEAGVGTAINTGDVYLGSGATMRVERMAGSGVGINARHGNTARTLSRGLVRLASDARLDVFTAGTGYGIDAHDLIVYAGSESVDHNSNIAPCEQDITTTTLNVVAGRTWLGARTASYSAVRVRSTGTETLPDVPEIWHDYRPSEGNGNVSSGPASGQTGFANSRAVIHENARVCILNDGTSHGGNAATNDSNAGAHGNSNGLFGSIGQFRMYANSTLDVEATNIAYRTTAFRSHTVMLDGAVASFYARPTQITGGNPVQGRSAMVLAVNYTSGSSGTSGNAARTMDRRDSRHVLEISGEGTQLNLEGYSSSDVGQTINNRGNVVINGDNSLLHVSNGAQVNNKSHNSSAFVFFGETSSFLADSGGQLNVEVGGSLNASTAAFRFLQTRNTALRYGSRFIADEGSMVSLRATGGDAALLRTWGGGSLFQAINGGVIEFYHEGDGFGVDFAAGNTCPNNNLRCQQADRFIVTGYRSEITMRINNGAAVSGSTNFDVGVPDNARDAADNANVTIIEATDGAIFDVIAAVSSAPQTLAHAGVGRGNTNNVQLGIFNAGRMHMLVDNPLYVNFTNNFHAGYTDGVSRSEGLIFHTIVSGVPDATRSTLRANSASLALWRNSRAGEFLHIPGVTGYGGFDDLNGDAAMSFHNTNFLLAPSATGFRNSNLVAHQLEACPDFWIVDQGYNKCAWDGFRDWFNGPAIPGSSAQTTVGGNNAATNFGWAHIRRMNMNNHAPIVDILRTPTDADNRIWGHVTIQEGNRSARSAISNEVFVDVNIYNPQRQLMQEILHAPTETRSIYGDDIHHGIFMTEVLFDLPVSEGDVVCPERFITAHNRTYFYEQDAADGTPGARIDCDYITDRTEQVIRIHRHFEEGTYLLPAGYTVEVAMARRTGTAQGHGAGVTGRGIDGVTGATPRYRQARWECREQDNLCHEGHLLIESEIVRDVTPPEIVSNVEATNVNVLLGNQLTPDSTHITGEGEPGATVRVGRVTAGVGPINATNPVTGVTWLDGSVTVGPNGQWSFPVPANANLQYGEPLSIYITDDVGFTPGRGERNLADLGSMTVSDLPEVIYRRYPGDTTMNSRLNLVQFSQLQNLRTVHTPWAGEPHAGNMGFHYPLRTSFHDAQLVTGLAGSRSETDLRFHHAYLIQVVAAVEVDFRWNFADAPNDGRFHLEEVVPGLFVPRPAVDPIREGYYFLGWFTTPTGNVQFNFNSPILEDTRVYAQWIGVQDFSFFKTDQNLYDYTNFANDVTLLPGAEFTFERRVYVPSDECEEYDENDATVCLVYEDGDYDWIRVGTSFISADGADLGRVNLQLMPGFIHRLIETNPPADFRPPSGHWYFDVGMDFRAENPNQHITITRSHRTTCLDSERDTDDNCPRYTDVAFVFRNGQWFVGNMLAVVDFQFIKVEEDLRTPLLGASFNLYRQNDQGNWLQTDSAVSELTGLVTLEGLTPGATYRLTEINAPAGFITPPQGHHYWLVTVSTSGEISVPVRHGHAPDFQVCTEANVADAGNLACTVVGTIILQNMLYTPLTGVDSNLELYLIGGLFVAILGLTARVYKLYKENREFVTSK